MDDGYGICPDCLWNGKLRKDGTVRKHKPMSNARQGRAGSGGGDPQDMFAPKPCTGTGQKPYIFHCEQPDWNA